MESKFSLLWRQDGSEGIKWYIRAIRPDGSFYGTISHWGRRRVATVSGSLSADETARVREITDRFVDRPSLPPGPCFALLARWIESISLAEVVYKYQTGDEATSEDARTFLKLKAILEGHVSVSYHQLA